MINSKTACAFMVSAAIFLAAPALSGFASAKPEDTGIILADDNGRVLLSLNRTKKFVPASILKILTSLAAIDFFGENFCFSTEYFFDQNSKNLYVKGFGDPLLISEVIEKLCKKIILSFNIKQIHNIFVDQTYFSKLIQIPGQGSSLNPYDAPVGALCANFNTIMFKWDQKKTDLQVQNPRLLFCLFL